MDMDKLNDGEMMKLVFPKIPPHNNVAEYLSSQAALSRLQVRTYQWDVARQNPDIYLTEARRKFNRTEETLAQKREHVKETRKHLAKQWEDIRKKGLELRDNFKKMNEFIFTNEAKRIRAIEKRKEDSELCKKRSKDIEKIREKLVFMEEAKKSLDQEIVKYNMYKQYLSVVLTHAVDFKNIDDLIDRYESLVRARNDLGKRQKKHLNELEVSKSKMTKINEQYVLRILGLNNVVAELNSRFINASRNAIRWENIVWNIKNRAFEKFQEIAEVKEACWNIYKLMCKRKSESSKIPKEDLESQLNYIKKTLRELNIINEQVLLRSRKSTVSSMKGQISNASN